MSSPWFVGILGVTTVFFGVKTILVFPTLLQLIKALISGSVRWPGPRIFDQNSNIPSDQQSHELPAKHLFPSFVVYAVSALFITFILIILFYNGFLQMALNTYLKAGYLLLLTLLAFTWGVSNSQRAIYLSTRVKRILANFSIGVELQQFDGFSAESEYAIEHPLKKYRDSEYKTENALILFAEATRNLQDGNNSEARTLYKKALSINPALHDEARAILSKMAEGCVLNEEGAICYWLGIHSEYLMDWKQAKVWYEKAANAYKQIGYPMRESRVHCNLGNVKMRMSDPTAMDEFEKAIILNPRNGTANLNIARTYYSLSYPGDERYELALDAFADAIVADPLTYGPKVISSLREIGYTWKEDLEEITKRVERKRAKESVKRHDE